MPYRIFNNLVFLLLFVFSCNSVEPPPNGEKPTLTLTLQDVSCTEAWMTLTTTNLPLPTNITLNQNNNVIDTINLTSQDTLLYIDSLLPNTNYKFHTVIQSSSHSSNEVSVTTMDTTSHNFTFETYTFGGDAGSCVLYDVAIIDENNIWAVGEIFIADTSINGYTTYNAVHWDGNEWELKRIKTIACGGVDYPPIKTIFAFAADDLLFAHIDGSITHYNGIEFINSCSLILQLNGSANKMWGISKNDFYVVSDNGFIAHYIGQYWQRIESGVTANINDVWGFVNNEGEKTIYSAVSYMFQSGERKILRINDNSLVDSIAWNNNKRVHSVWIKNVFKQFACGDGVFINSEPGMSWKEQTELPLYYSRRIRGTDVNNIIVTGDYGLFAHYSGTGWQDYNELSISGIYMSLDIKNYICIAVGLEGNKAVIVLGTQN